MVVAGVQARIYRQSKPAGQSGLIGTREWILEYGQTAPRVQDPLMGWTGSCGDTLSQISTNIGISYITPIGTLNIKSVSCK